MRLVFVGTGGIGIPALEALLKGGHQVSAVVTQPDKPVGRHQVLQGSEIKAVALREGLPVLQPERLKSCEAVAALKALDPEVMVVMAYGQILSTEVLGIPRVACLNLHASLLPRHRGAAPIQAALEAGDSESGVTVMYMDEGLDTGDILLRRSVRLGRRETGGILHDRLAAVAGGAILEALELLRSGKAPREKQDASLATYARKLSREDGRLDWASSPAAVDRRVRAMNPWPGAYTILPTVGGRGREGSEGRKLKVFSVIQSRVAAEGAPAGMVLRVEKRGVLVAAGLGTVWLGEVQMEGKRRMRVCEFLRGTSVSEGIVLGGARHS